MRPRLVIPLVLLTVLAVLVWIAGELAGGGGVAAEAPALASRIPREGTADAGRVLGVATPAALAQRGREATAGSQDAAASTGGEAVASADGSAGLRVRVVEKASGDAVPGARLRWLEVEGEDAARARDLARIDALLAERAHGARADEHGVALLSWSRERSLAVVAEHGELWASRVVTERQAEDELRVELVPDFAVDVHVRGPAGAREGLRVALQVDRTWSQEQSLVTSRTDAEGRVRLPHAGAAIQRQGDEGQNFVVQALVPLAQPLKARFDPAERREPVVLELPPTGSVEVLATDLFGEPIGAGEVQLSAPDPSRSSVMHFVPSNQPGEPLSEGLAVFPAVGLELELTATVRVPALGATSTLRFPGPRLAGERMRATVLLGSDHPVLRLRAVDEQGAVLGDAQLHVRIDALPTQEWWSARDATQRRARTEEDGTFHVHLGVEGDEGPFALHLVEREPRGRSLTVRLAEDDARGPLEARLEIDRVLGGGLAWLGDLVLRPPPLLAGGRVVRSDGRPVAGARVMAFALEGEEERLRPILLGLSATTDDEGRYMLRGSVSGSRLRLQATAAELAGAELDCAPGAEDAELVLLEPGRITGELAGSGDVSLWIRAQRTGELPEAPTGASRPLSTSRSASAKAGGDFRIGDLAPGLYEIHVQAGAAKLASVPDVHVPAGGAAEDPRLTPIVLAGDAQRVVVTLVPSDPSVPVRGLYTSNPEEQSFFLFESRRIVLTGEAPFLLRVYPEGHRPVHLENLSSDRTVHLEPGLDVKLVLPEGLRLPASPLWLSATVSDPTNRDPVIGFWSSPTFDREGVLTHRVSSPGELDVGLLLRRGPMSWLVSGGPRRIHVLDVPHEQRFELDVTQEALDQAVELAGRAGEQER